MNKLLIFLAVVAIVVAGLFILRDMEILSEEVVGSLLFNEAIFSPILLGVIVAGLGFIRFNKFIGIASMALGILLVLSAVEVIPFYIIPVFLYPWILAALGVRFFVIGIFSGENRA